MKSVLYFIVAITAAATKGISGDFLSFATYRDASQPDEEPVAIQLTFINLEQLRPVSTLVTTGFLAISPITGDIAVVAYQERPAKEISSKGCTVIQYNLTQGKTITRYQHPRALDFNETGPLPGVSPLIPGTNGIVWLHSAEWKSEKEWFPRLEAVDLQEGRIVSTVELPKKSTVARIEPLGGGCLVTYIGYPTATLYLQDGRSTTCELVAADQWQGFFEPGISKGNRAWGLNRANEMVIVEYRKEQHDLRSKLVKIIVGEETKKWQPIGMRWAEGETLLEVTYGDGDDKIRLVRLLESASGKVIKQFLLPEPAHLVVFRNQRLYTVLENETRITIYDSGLRVVEKSPSFFPFVLGQYFQGTGTTK